MVLPREAFDRKNEQPSESQEVLDRKKILDPTPVVIHSPFLAPDAWNCRKLQVSLKVAIDVPMLGTIIETNGDSLDDSHMPIGWPLLIDGAVRQFCVHRYTTIQNMQDMLKAYDLGKNSVEINKDAPQWTHFSVWNRRYMDPLPGNDLRQMWQECEPAIGRKIAPPMKFEPVILGRTAFGSPNSIYLSNPKNGHQTNQTVQ